MRINHLNLNVLFVLVLSAGLLASTGLAWAKPPINTDWWGVALKGYDPVAYFTRAKPIKGSKKYEYQWMQAKWRFASDAHRNLFMANPERYAPRYGGY